MTFQATKKSVYNRGAPPDGFLHELVDWAKTEDGEVFAPNAVPLDIFTAIKSSLATFTGYDGVGAPMYRWDNPLQRKAALCEAMRVHAMFESSATWILGVDTTNHHSMTHLEGAETGIFQVSFNSIYLGHNAMRLFAVKHDIETPEKFIRAMKSDHRLALSYYARLVRVSIAWAGPLLRHGQDSVYPWLSRAAVEEFMAFLQCPNPTS